MASLHIVYDENDKVMFNRPENAPALRGVHFASLRLDEHKFTSEGIEGVGKELIALLLRALQ